jgi:nitrogen regulatory protein PII
MCSAIITVVDDEKVDSLLDALHKMDKETEQLGLRAFVWNVEKTI